jgi:hypothetical protein
VPGVTVESNDLKSKKATLFDFVEENSKLITSMAAFAALTAFLLTQVKDDEFRILPGFTLLAALLLMCELFMRSMRTPERHWRLELFELSLAILLAGVGWFWLKTFPSVWGMFVYAIVVLAFVLGIPTLLTLLFRLTVKVIVRAQSKEIAPERLLPLERIAFGFFLFLTGVAIFWARYKWAGHQFKIHIPF